MKEPSVLDFLKSRLNPWQKEKIQIPPSAESVDSPRSFDIQASGAETIGQDENSPKVKFLNSRDDDGMREITIRLRMPVHIPWRSLLAFSMALIAQRNLEPSASAIPIAVGFYSFALILLGWAHFDGEFSLPISSVESQQIDPQSYHRNSLLFALILALSAFFLFSDNLFSTLNVSLWLVALGLFLRGLWLSSPGKPTFWRNLSNFFKKDPWQISITRWAVILFAITALIIFFRFYRLDGVPGEPFSDHAEKLLDVFDITQGQTHIFFPRNTGREFLQFYWTAAIASLLGTGLTFLSLKIGTALIGLFALPYIYLIGKEVGGKRVALFALIMAGTSYWLNTISRIGLRFPLYPAFAAPALYYLIRGLRRQSRNDFILSGLFLGLGLHGYSPFRIVPLLMLLGVGLYLLHKQSQGHRTQTALMFSILVLGSFLVFLPLLRYAIDNPDMFSYRALTRLTGEEHPLPAPAWQIFASNTYNAMRMFNYDDGEIWVHSIPHRPALDIISGVLFVFGYFFLFIRYLRKRDWLDLFLFLSVPMLLMPSILSLAFPAENPSLNRTGGAAVVVFVIAGMALDGFYLALRGVRKSGWQGFSAVLVVGLLLFSSLQNYSLVFETFSTQFMLGAWNTSDMGKVIRSFVDAGNSPDNGFVVPFPYWVDTRLVGIQAGYPTLDFALWRDDLPKSLSVPGSKLFLIKEEDKETLDVLQKLYPTGLLGHFTNPLEGKNFWIYTVPENQLTIP